MGCGSSADKPQDAPVARMQTIKVLLLGAGECGKSTIFKQIQIHNSEGFSEDDFLMWRTRMMYKLLQTTQAVLQECQDPIQETISGLDLSTITTWDSCILWQDQLKKVWEEPAMIATLERLRSLGNSMFDDSVNMMLRNVPRIASPDFMPSQDDILQFRFPTADISVVTYPVPDNDNVILRFVDVGGQRPERVKWNQLGTGVDFVIYVSALDDYDKTLVEDATKNRLRESLMLYKMVVCKHFEGTPVILFLNKKDLFEEKIKRVPLSSLFPDYEGEADFEQAVGYVEQKFKDMRAQGSDTGKWHCQVTCALDTDQMGDILRAVGKLFAMQCLDDLFTIE